MDIDVQQRRVRLSVGELAEFRSGPRDTGRGRTGRWRMEAGSTWHRELQTQVQAATSAPDSTETAAFEVPIAGTWIHKGWSIDLQGRIDQVIRSPERTLLREVKTVRTPLPEREDILHAAYPSYFAQAATYLALAGLLPEYAGQPLSAELFFVDINDGVTQAVQLDAGARALFDSQLDTLWHFIEARRSTRERLDAAEFRAPFESLRPGQELVDQALDRAARQAPIRTFEAPTGFGKTAYALHFALRELQARHVDRLIYLSGKSTGQIQVINELQRAWEGALHYYQMRSKAEHAIRSPMHSCDELGGNCRENIEERWAHACINPARLLAGGGLNVDAVREIGIQTGVCPYEISRAVLPFADLWVGDYNYVFHPRSNGVFLNQPGFEASRTLLLVDEAHNLPNRVADAWSAALDAQQLDMLGIELGFAGAPERLKRALGGVHDFVAHLEPCGRLELADVYALRDVLEQLAEQLNGTPLNPDDFQPGTLEGLWSVVDALLPLDNESLELLAWVPRRGELRLTCTDASAQISEDLKQFGGVLLLSATLRPRESFLQSCGLDPATTAGVAAEAPWRAGAYTVAADMRVDTRFRTRGQFTRATAATVTELTHFADGPVAVLFPSYRYAETVANALLDDAPGLRVVIQPRGVDLAGQRAFVEEALEGADVLMLVLGSGFTEGIDALGGRISHAMVVSPGLPEADAVQAARMEQLSHLGNSRAFREVYQIPGMRKINQALGRLVRAPGQSTRVLLHCRRFGEAGFSALLDADFQPDARIRNDGELLDWLESSQRAQVENG